MKGSVVSGLFEAERFWRDDSICRLPTLFNKNNFVSKMDRLLFPFCSKDDILLTGEKFDPAQKEFLSSCHIDFTSLQFPETDKTDNPYLKLSNSPEPALKEQIMERQCNVFAVVPGVKEFCTTYSLKEDFPNLEVIRRVNSKAFSTKLSSGMEHPFHGMVITGINELENLLTSGKPMLVKDVFGVSGKGSYLADSQSSITYLFKGLQKQISNGKKLYFVVEPYLNKKLDFSCQFYVGKKGMTLESIQVIRNNNLSYGGTITADKEFLSYLEKEKYLQVMESVAEAMAQEGYYGDACVDSMVLTDDTIIPIVEINARKSMSLIKRQIEKRLNTEFPSGMFIQEFFLSKALNFSSLLEILQARSLLYRPGETGIFPILLLNGLINQDKKIYQHRLYYLSISSNIDYCHQKVLSILEEYKSGRL